MKKPKKDKILEATAERVAACKTCNGNPKLVTFDIPEYKGWRCDECFEITSYEDKQINKF